MLRVFRRILLVQSIVLICVMSSTQLLLSQVNATLILPSQMPAEIPAWTEDLNTQIQIVIINTSGASIPNVRIVFQVNDKDRGKTVVQTKDNDPSLPRFTIPSQGAVTRFAKDIIIRRALTIDKSIESIVTSTNTIPEGNYEFCVKIINEQGNVVTIADQYCKPFFVSSPDPPQLITPVNNVALTTATLPLFTWSPIVGGLPGAQIRYKLKVVPIFKGQLPRVALDANPRYLDKILFTTNYQYTPADVPLKNYPDAIGYVWMVQAMLSNGAITKPYGRNEGKSEIWMFTFQSVVDSSNRKSKVTLSNSNREKKNSLNYADSSTIPTSVLSGNVQWAFRKSEISGGGLTQFGTTLTGKETLGIVTGSNEKGATKLLFGDAIKAQEKSSHTVSAMSKQNFETYAESTRRPLANVIVRLYIVGEFDTLITVKSQIKGVKDSIYTATKTKSIPLGTTYTTSNGDFSFNYIAPSLTMQSTLISGDDSDTYKDVEGKSVKSGGSKSIEKKKRQYTVRVEVISPYFYSETVNVVLDENIQQKTSVGTINALARTVRIQAQIYGLLPKDKQPELLKDTSARIMIYRPTSWYDTYSFGKNIEGQLSTPIKNIGQTTMIAGQQVRLIAEAGSDDVIRNIFINKSGADDILYIRSVGKTKDGFAYDTITSWINIDESKVREDVVAQVVRPCTVMIKNRRILSGIVRQVFDTDKKLVQEPGVIPVVLIPIKADYKTKKQYADTAQRIETMTTPDGSYAFENIPLGEAYYLQCGGALYYLSYKSSMKLVQQKVGSGHIPILKSISVDEIDFDSYNFYAGIIAGTNSLGNLIIGDNTADKEVINIYFFAPAVTILGRMVNDIGIPIDGTIQHSMQGTDFGLLNTGGSGGFLLIGRYGTNTLTFDCLGHKQKTFTQVIAPAENYGVPDISLDFVIKDMINKMEKKPGGGNPIEAIKEKMKDPIFDPYEQTGKGMKEKVFGKWVAAVTSGGTLAEKLDVSGSKMTPYSPAKSGYATSSTSMTSVIKNSNGTTYNTTDVGSFNTAFNLLVTGGAVSTKGAKGFGKDAVFEDDEFEVPLPDTVDLGKVSLKRSSTLKVLVRGKGCSSSVAEALSSSKVDVVMSNNSAKNGVISALTNTNGVAVIESLLPGASTIRVYPPAGTNYVPEVIDVTIYQTKKIDRTYKSTGYKIAKTPVVDGKVTDIKDTYGSSKKNTNSTSKKATTNDNIEYIDTTVVEVVLELGGCVSGVITDDDGKALSNATVRIKETDGVIDVSTTTNTKGEFTLRGAAGIIITDEGNTVNRTLAVTAKGYNGVSKPITLNKCSATCLLSTNIALKKMPIVLTTLYGFDVQVDSYNSATKKITGSFINIPTNSIFTFKNKSTLRFKNLPILVSNGVGTEISPSITLDIEPEVDVRAYSSIPITLKNISVRKQSNGTGIITTSAKSGKLAWEEYFPQGAKPWSIQNKDGFFITNSPSDNALIAFASSQNAVGTKLQFASNGEQTIRLWYDSVAVITNSSSVLNKDGIYLDGTTRILTSNLVKNKSFGFSLAIASNGGLQYFDAKLMSTPITFDLGNAFSLKISALTIQDNGIRTSGELAIKAGKVLSTSLPFSNFKLGTSKFQDAKIDISNANLKLFNTYPLSSSKATGQSYSLYLANKNEMYYLESEECKLSVLSSYLPEGLAGKVALTQDGSFAFSVMANLSREFFDIASIAISSVTISSNGIDVNGALGLKIPGFASVQGSGMHFKANGSFTMDKISTTVKFGPAELKVKDLAFGEFSSSSDMIPDLGGLKSSLGKSGFEGGTKKGFAVDNISMSIPGSPISCSAGFYYFKSADGIDFGSKFKLENSPFVFPIGPVSVTLLGGGFAANTSITDYSVFLTSSISVAKADKLLAINPANIGIGINKEGPYVFANGNVTLLDKIKAAKASILIHFAKLTLSANLFIPGSEILPGVTANGSVTVEAKGTGDKYIYAGLSAKADLLDGLAKGFAGVLIGYGIPVGILSDDYKRCLPDGVTGKYSGVATRVSTTIGRPADNPMKTNLGICTFKIWYGTTADAQVYIGSTGDSWNPTFGFAYNSVWSAGVKCGKVGVSGTLGGGLGGGYNKPGQECGWYFNGNLNGGFEVCFVLCYNPSATISVDYKQKCGGLNYDIDVDY